MKLQQGDVILTQVNYKVKGKKLDHLTLAEGEATGHHHSIVSGLGQLIMMDKIMHLQVFSETALLKHQEHDFREKIRKCKIYENIDKKDYDYMKINNLLPNKNEPFSLFVERLPRETIIPKGSWKIKIVREYDPFEEEIRRVAD
jgi:hypothetical protein